MQIQRLQQFHTSLVIFETNLEFIIFGLKGYEQLIVV